MSGRQSTVVCLLLFGASLAAQSPVDRADIDVKTSVNQTALWVGQVVTYSVALTCRPDVDVLQEDLGADKLPLEGLQVVGHSIDRRVTGDGRTHYVVSYRVTTFEPGAEALGIGDWTVRYVAGVRPQGGSAPARDLRIPGAALAWRSALPGALNTLAIRDLRAPDPAPRWWLAARPAGLALIALAIAASGWALVRRATAGRPAKEKRRPGRAAARDLQNTLAALREVDVASAAQRLAAYGTLDAALRRHAGDLADLPAAALTPQELGDRLRGRALVSADAIERVLAECHRARYQPEDRLPDQRQFQATLDAASELVASTR